MNKKKSIITVVVLTILVVIAVVAWVDIKSAKAPEVPGGASVNTSTVAVASSSAPSTGSSTGVTASSSAPSLTIQKFYGNGSFSFSYPTAWVIETYAPFSMNNFKSKYASGGIIPEGGAVIQVVTSTSYGPLQDIMTTQLMSSTNVVTSTVVVGGVTCAKANYQNTYPGGIASRDISIYCKRGTSLWEIFLSYRAVDPAGLAHVSDFNSVLASMKFLP